MLTESLEDYLEAIQILKEEKKVARVKEIGNLLNVKNSSVVNALNILKKKGLIIHEKYGYVDFTEKGKREAKKIHRKHKIILKFLEEVLGVPHEIALRDACRIEHVISKETFKRIKKFVSH